MDIEEIKKLINSNSNYWEKRSLQNKLSAIENEEDYVKRITGIYNQASKDIQSKLANVYARYAKENGMTLDEAYKKLPKAAEKEYKKDILDYVNKAKSGDPKWKQYLLNQSLMHSHSVLNQLQTEYRKVIYDIDIEETGGKFLEKIFTDSNYKAQYAMGDEEFAKVDKNKIQNLLAENWSGDGNFSQLIWKDKQKLINALDDIVIKGLATGQSYDDMANKLAKRMDTSKSNAKRLIMTESARMENEGLLSYYKRTGVKKLIFVATLDNRTSEICRAMDGAIIPIEEAKLGLNVPPLHPYCRSVISPYYEDNIPEDRVYRDKDNNKTQSGKYKTYIDYLANHLGDKEQAKALASKRNDLETLTKATGYIDKTSAMILTNGLIDIQPDNNLVTKNNEEYTDFVEKHQEEIGSVEKMEEDIKNDLAKLLEEGEMATRTSMESLEKIIEDGRIRSQFETGKSSTRINAEIRKGIEKELFGYSFDLDNSLRPIYGYLTNIKDGFEFSSKNGAMMYGNVTIILKKKDLSKKTTFTIGDSLDGTRYNFKVPSLYDNPAISSISANKSLTDSYGKFTGKLGNNLEKVTTNVSYVELQFHGGVSIKNIEKVYIHTYINTFAGKKKLNIDDKQLSKLEKLLNKAGIEYEVVR